jgi:hypothetical protein
MRRIALSIALAAIYLGVLSPPAVAENARCVGTLPPGTYDNVVVPRDTDCFLTGAVVRGNVKVLRGAALFSNLNRIEGNVQGNRPRFVGSVGDTIGGNFQVTGATGQPGFPFDGLSVNVFVCGTRLTDGNVAVEKSRNGTVVVGTQLEACQGNIVAGNVKVEKNFIPPGEFLAVARNTVGGNVQVFENTGQGGKSVIGNVVRQKLQCKRNDEPFIGGPSTARPPETAPPTRAAGRATRSTSPESPGAPTQGPSRSTSTSRSARRAYRCRSSRSRAASRPDQTRPSSWAPGSCSASAPPSRSSRPMAM